MSKQKKKIFNILLDSDDDETVDNCYPVWKKGKTHFLSLKNDILNGFAALLIRSAHLAPRACLLERASWIFPHFPVRK